jgi:putative copper export protein
MAATVGVLTGWLLFCALVLMVGSVVARWLILPRVAHRDAAPQAWLSEAAGRVGGTAANTLPVVMLLVLLRQIREFRDPFASLTEDVGLLLGTPWGTAWLWSLFGSVVAAAAFRVAAAGRRWAWWVATASTTALASFPGMTGHAAAGEGGLRWLTLLSDTLHVLAAGAWVGGLAVVLLLDRRWCRSPEAPQPASLLPALVPAFSPVAVASVATLIITGSLASWIHLPTFDALWETAYGRLLALKVGLVLAVLAMGAVNWKRLTPLLADPEGPPAMRKVAAAELAIATAVLLATALLVRTSPL